MTKTKLASAPQTGVEEDEQIAYSSGSCYAKVIATETGAHEIEFYGVSLAIGFELKTVAKDLLAAMAVLFTGVGQENTTKLVTKNYKQADGATVEESYRELHGIESKLAEVKALERNGAIRKLVESFADEKSQIAMAMFVMDSARKQFKRPVTAQAAKAFVGTVGADVFVDMLKGALYANKNVLGPLGASLQGLFGKALEAVNKAGSEQESAVETVPPLPPSA